MSQHLHDRMELEKLLLAYCPTCQKPVHAMPRQWEPDVGWWLCMERVWNPNDLVHIFSVCQSPLWVLEDQDAALAAYHLGDWPAVIAMARAQGPNAR